MPASAGEGLGIGLETTSSWVIVMLCIRLHTRTQTGYTHAVAYCTHKPTHPRSSTVLLIWSAGIWLSVPAQLSSIGWEMQCITISEKSKAAWLWTLTTGHKISLELLYSGFSSIKIENISVSFFKVILFFVAGYTYANVDRISYILWSFHCLSAFASSLSHFVLVLVMCNL